MDAGGRIIRKTKHLSTSSKLHSQYEKVVPFAGSESPTKCGNSISLNPASNAGNGVLKRWVNSLNPNVGKDSWSLTESIELLKLHRKYGNAWKKMTHVFQTRTDQAIKNHFYSFLRKILRQLSRCLNVTYISGIIAKARPKALSEFANQPLELSEKSQRALASLQSSPELMYDLLEQFALGNPLFQRGKIPHEVKSDLQISLNRLVEIESFN